MMYLDDIFGMRRRWAQAFCRRLAGLITSAFLLFVERSARSRGTMHSVCSQYYRSDIQ